MRRHGVRRVGAVLVLALVLGSCSDDDASSTATTTTTAGETTTSIPVPEFTGDPDSPFCTLIDAAEDRSVLDPFETDLEPREVDLRLRALRLRFAEFAEAAPPELEDELDDLVAALDDLDAALDDVGYDFAALGESGTDLGAFDAPQFAETAVRIDAYRSQVCAT